MNPMRMFWGILLAGIGVLILGAEAGWWAGVSLLNLLSFWPIILVIIGLRLLIHDDVVFAILMIAALLLVGYLAVTGKNAFGAVNLHINSSNQISEQSTSENLGSNVKKATINLNLGAAKLDILALNEADSKNSLIKIDGENLGTLSTSREDNNEQAIFSATEETKDGIYLGPVIKERSLTAKITNQIPLTLNVNTGASTATLDLASLKIENFELNSGANTGDITFGNSVALLTAKIKTGASKITIRVPKGIGLKLDYDRNALNNRNFANGLSLNQTGDNNYETPNYASTEHKINLTISAGVSDIQISEY